MIEYIAKNTNDKKLKSIIDNNNKELENYKWGMDVLDFMNINPNFKIDITDFLGLLKSLQHRTYSISSSLNKVKNEVHLTVSSVRWKKDSRNYNGVCSTFLADDCTPGDNIKVFFTPNKSFRLPDDNKDIIMIGPGTGIAPLELFYKKGNIEIVQARTGYFLETKQKIMTSFIKMSLKITFYLEF